jgi:hypothetical protein
MADIESHQAILAVFESFRPWLKRITAARLELPAGPYPTIQKLSWDHQHNPIDTDPG